MIKKSFRNKSIADMSMDELKHFIKVTPFCIRRVVAIQELEARRENVSHETIQAKFG